MKILVVATDIRSFLDLKNIVIELKKQEVDYFFLYSQSLTRQNPSSNLDLFGYDTNIEIKSSAYNSKTLGISLPFIPDVLLITNENWFPEKHILWEFKQLGSVIACVENTTWLVGTIKSRLEMLSRMNFPTNCIDIFFENSEWSLETKKLCGWYNFKSVIVGNPKYDDLQINSTEDDGILVFGTMEKEANTQIQNILSHLNNFNQKIYYRPHPGETIQNFNYKNIELVTDLTKVPYIAANTKIHLANISISAYYSTIYNKHYVSIDEFIGRNNDLQLDFFKGPEYNFWAPIIKVNSWDEFVSKVNNDRVYILQQRYNFLKNQVTQYHNNLNFDEIDCNFLDSKLFDEYSDNNASKRIVNYLKTYI
jgi:hypothetical protein